MSDQVAGNGAGSRTRADWERLVAAYERREGTREAFCAAAGISATSLDYWRRKLKRELSSAAPGFVELPVTGAVDERAQAFEVELLLGGGMVLRLRRG